MHKNDVMKRTTYYLFTLFILIISACSNSEKQSQNENDSTDAIGKTGDVADTDTAKSSFFKNAGYGGLKEVEFSNRVIRTTADKNIKSFAEMMVKDHQMVNGKLVALAKLKGYQVPTVLPADELKLITDQWSALKEDGKDQFYINLMKAEHEKAIDVFSLASRADDNQLSTFANMVLPTLKSHYAQVLKIDSVLKTPAYKQGDDPLNLSERKKP